MAKPEYLNPEFMKWPIKPEDFDFWPTRMDEGRPYELWSHAEALLERGQVREYRADAMANLKRAIFLRIRDLNSLYRFRDVPVIGRARHLMDILARLSLIRPVLLRNIVELRNQIEHEDSVPPDEVRCREWVEFTWYFLRSTDPLLGGGCRAIEFYQPAEGRSRSLWVVVTNGPGGYLSPLIHGWVSPSMLSDSNERGWLSLEITERRGEYDWSESPLGELAHIQKPNRSNEILFIQGRVLGSSEILADLAKRFFEARVRWPMFRPTPNPRLSADGCAAAEA